MNEYGMPSFSPSKVPVEVRVFYKQVGDTLVAASDLESYDVLAKARQKLPVLGGLRKEERAVLEAGRRVTRQSTET